MTNDITTFQAVMLALGVASFFTAMLAGTAYTINKLWHEMLKHFSHRPSARKRTKSSESYALTPPTN